MTEFTKRYYPTVSIRRGEMRALEKLPRSVKAEMLPIALLAPWLNSIKFQNTFNILSKSVGDLPVIVDLDRYYQSASTLESRTYFWSLFDKEVGPANWMKLVEDQPNYIPCLQALGLSREKIEQQISWARQLGRGFCLRLEMERYIDFDDQIEIIESCVQDDFLIILDFGYSDFSGALKDAITDLLNRIYQVSADLKVTLCGSNFPNNFSDFDDFSQSQEISSRSFYNELGKIFGNYNFFYGDWASTKPRKYDGGGSKPLDRIDFPTATSWIIARSKEESWNLRDASERITRLPEWETRPKVWGTGMIEKTALGIPGGINTHPEAIAARINIHLFTQANYGGGNQDFRPKGKWKDPI